MIRIKFKSGGGAIPIVLLPGKEQKKSSCSFESSRKGGSR